jgi:hypothetical protein
VTASVEEYIDLVPPERFPSIHVPAPAVRPDSKVDITLSRSMCYGRCPVYKISVSTEGIVFDGEAFVAAKGRHTDTVDPSAVRALAKKFVAADFYSMRDEYRASVTDNSTYTVSIAIDGHKKQVVDYVGQWVGMPAVIVELEDDVDALANTDRWIKRATTVDGSEEGKPEPARELNLNMLTRRSFRCYPFLKQPSSPQSGLTPET